MAFVYFTGLNHFRNSRLYLKIIPPYFRIQKLNHIISGLAEIILAIALCIPALSHYGAWE
jgi:uncharacterized membrane protein